MSRSEPLHLLPVLFRLLAASPVFLHRLEAVLVLLDRPALLIPHISALPLHSLAAGLLASY